MIRALVASAACLVIGAAEAHAHVMPAHQGTMAVRGRQAYIALSLPAALFREADDDHDGRLSVAEVVAHAELLQRLTATRIHVDDASHTARLEYAQVIVERLDDDMGVTPRPATDVLVLVVTAFDVAPSAITLSIDGLESIAGGADAGRVTIRASHADTPGAATESVTLRAGHPTATFFASAWRRAGDAALEGVRHIFSGPDHLLFLLTLALAGTGWRYLASVVSSFTLAHAVVLVAAAEGHAPPVPAAWAEVLIAGTILLMAVRVLIARPQRLPREASLAALCGFVHGLGVVEAVRALETGGRADLVTLGSFNAGVELAQLLAIVVAVIALRGLGRAFRGRERIVALVPNAAAFAAGLAALVWLVARLPQVTI